MEPRLILLSITALVIAVELLSLMIAAGRRVSHSRMPAQRQRVRVRPVRWSRLRRSWRLWGWRPVAALLRSRSRFTVRRIMAGVLCVATFLAAVILGMRGSPAARDCRRIAAIHAQEEQHWRRLAQKMGRMARSPSKAPAEAVLLDKRADSCRKRAEYHARMRGKWVRAASSPWIPVEPDPPPP
jgi:hypothetical protein